MGRPCEFIIYEVNSLITGVFVWETPSPEAFTTAVARILYPARKGKHLHGWKGYRIAMVLWNFVGVQFIKHGKSSIWILPRCSFWLGQVWHFGAAIMPIDPKFLDLLDVASHDCICLSCWLEIIGEYLSESLSLSYLICFYVARTHPF